MMTEKIRTKINTIKNTGIKWYISFDEKLFPIVNNISGQKHISSFS